jgi:hypothetical protein
MYNVILMSLTHTESIIINILLQAREVVQYNQISLCSIVLQLKLILKDSIKRTVEAKQIIDNKLSCNLSTHTSFSTWSCFLVYFYERSCLAAFM